MHMSVSARTIAGVVLLAHIFSPAISAAPFAPTGNRGSDKVVTKVHGFHCRPEVGWDATLGYYRRHSHRGICRDYQGCMREQQRCIFMLGRGWDVWKYERWGSENWRYTNCMIRAGCN
jgi:hypothetical protein